MRDSWRVPRGASTPAPLAAPPETPLLRSGQARIRKGVSFYPGGYDFAAARAKALLAALAAPRTKRNGFAITFPEMTKQALSYG